jgi:hypothetical protein
MPAAVPIVGGVMGLAGSYMQGRSAKKAANTQAQAIRDAAAMQSPQNVMGAARMYNPYIFQALMNPNQATQNPFQQNLNNIARNPGYIDPALMNQAYTQAQRGSQQAMINAQGLLGRTGAEGGMADAYALANQAALTGTRSNLMQGYSLWREQQRRADIDQLMNMYNQAINQGMGGQAQFANTYANIPQQPGYSQTGNMIGSIGNFLGGLDWSKFRPQGQTQNFYSTAPRSGQTNTMWGSNLFGGQGQKPFGA